MLAGQPTEECLDSLDVKLAEAVLLAQSVRRRAGYDEVQAKEKVEQLEKEKKTLEKAKMKLEKRVEDLEKIEEQSRQARNGFQEALNWNIDLRQEVEKLKTDLEASQKQVTELGD